MLVEIEMIDYFLGTLSADMGIFNNYIKPQIPEGVDILEDAPSDDLGYQSYISIFSRHPDSKNLCVRDYQFKGFLKSRGDALRARQRSMTGPKNNPYYGIKGKIDDHVFIYPKFINLGVTKPDAIMKRPLRAFTRQGERVTLVASECMKPGAKFLVEIMLMGNVVKESMIKEILDEGRHYGMGKWRNSGCGRFIWKEIEEDYYDIYKRDSE